MAQKQLADEHDRHEALHEVAETVVGIARQAEPLLGPMPSGNLGVGPMPADDEDRRMEREQAVGQRRERKAAVRRDEDGDRDEHRQVLEQPSEAIGLGGDAEEDEQGGDRQKEDEGFVAHAGAWADCWGLPGRVGMAPFCRWRGRG